MTSRTTVTLEGFAPAGREKYYLDVPFEMPTGVARLDVHYHYSEQISSDPTLSGGNTVDIGLFDWRGEDFLKAGFRGWSGSERSEFFVTPTDATPGYMPGPLTPGMWHVSLGFYKVGPNGCHYTVDVTFEFGETHVTDFAPMLTLDSPNYHPPRHEDGWYKGELHCHTIHSDGDSTAKAVIDAAQALGLDFLAVTDHNNVTHLMEIAALGVQKIVLIPGYEVTTYRGHWNVWGPDTWVDFRVMSPDDMQKALNFAYDHVALASVNHPRPYGPPWEYEQVYSKQCVEVWNGPWMYMNDIALGFWEERLKRGERLVAVGGSDMHRLHQEHEARLGTPTTWIYCPGEPTAARLLAELRAGHAFLSDAPDGPRLYFSSGKAMSGDVVKRDSDTLDVTVRVTGGTGLTLQLIGSDGILRATPVVQDDQPFIFTVPIAQTSYVRAQLVQPDSEDLVVRALTNPIYIE
ncbi:MAG: PHP domain-containing protein [Chloroflexi bacterium]|nr:PHP domain-containing protein [Chloroflexota bacterium]